MIHERRWRSIRLSTLNETVLTRLISNLGSYGNHSIYKIYSISLPSCWVYQRHRRKSTISYPCQTLVCFDGNPSYYPQPRHQLVEPSVTSDQPIRSYTLGRVRMPYTGYSSSLKSIPAVWEWQGYTVDSFSALIF